MATRNPARSITMAACGAATGVLAVMFGTGHGIALTASAESARGDSVFGGDSSSSNNAGADGTTAAGDSTSNSGIGSGSTTDSGTSAGDGSSSASQQSGSANSNDSGSGSQDSPAPTASTPSSPVINGMFTGDTSYSNPYGPCQVRITVTNGKITNSELVQMPQDFTSYRISTQAASYLKQEVLAAQSAQVSWIGGASLTSPAYIESLASAIAKAGL